MNLLLAGALQQNFGDVRAVVGENATAGIFATYPTEGISTVSTFKYKFYSEFRI